jgi:hypothetical protein
MAKIRLDLFIPNLVENQEESLANVSAQRRTTILEDAAEPEWVLEAESEEAVEVGREVGL